MVSVAFLSFFALRLRIEKQTVESNCGDMETHFTWRPCVMWLNQTFAFYSDWKMWTSNQTRASADSEIRRHLNPFFHPVAWNSSRLHRMETTRLDCVVDDNVQMFPWKIFCTRVAPQSIKSLFGWKSLLVKLITFSKDCSCVCLWVCVAFVSSCAARLLMNSQVFSSHRRAVLSGAGAQVSH